MTYKVSSRTLSLYLLTKRNKVITDLLESKRGVLAQLANKVL